VSQRSEGPAEAGRGLKPAPRDREIFEGSAWVAERAWERGPFASVEELHAAMVDQVRRASREEQLALLRAHPDLGTRARMAPASESEQAGAGLDRMPADAFEKLQRLNVEYRKKFGFPFLFAVKGSSWVQVLAVLEERLGRPAEEEFATALEQVYRIAWFRLES
jgi:2-oxo-4-hydroxy-4-carboxy-5-ureidoimidazoline decarboxylase